MNAVMCTCLELGTDSGILWNTSPRLFEVPGCQLVLCRDWTVSDDNADFF